MVKVSRKKSMANIICSKLNQNLWPTQKWADISHSILEDKCSTKTGSMRKKRRMKSSGFAPNKEESTSRTNKRKTKQQ
jgi:hypothetical protein